MQAIVISLLNPYKVFLTDLPSYWHTLQSILDFTAAVMEMFCHLTWAYRRKTLRGVQICTLYWGINLNNKNKKVNKTSVPQLIVALE